MKQSQANQEEYRAILDEIRHHDYCYYVLNQPEISDYDYDILWKKLIQIEKEHPDWVLLDSPSQRVGHTPLSHFEKISRKIPMLSLDNTYNEKEVTEFYERVRKGLEVLEIKDPIEFIIEPKIDGISIELTYLKGRFVQGTTRGDGIVGEDVTFNVRTISSLPLVLNNDVDLVVRGEIYMEKKDFLSLNQDKIENGEIPFKNPRNATGGTLKQLDPKIVAKRPLKLLVYEVLKPIESIKTYHDSIEYLRKLGLPAYSSKTIVHSLTELIEQIHICEKIKNNFAYEIDGIVIKLNSFYAQQALGFTARAPRYSIAYKFKPEQAVAILKEVQFQVGRTGVITPVAIFSPVHLSGTEVSRASLHNFDQLNRLNLHKNDQILVEKAGEIIPQIVGVLSSKEEVKKIVIEVPTHCPSCATVLIKNQEEVATRCPNTKNCPAQLIEKITFFTHRDAMNIENLGPKLIEQLVQRKMIHEISDLYSLTLEQLLTLPRMGMKSAQNVRIAIEKSKTCTLSQFITGLGIPGIGWVWAKKIADSFIEIEKLIYSEKEFIQEKLESIHGFGEERAKEVANFFSNPDQKFQIKKFIEYGVYPKEEAKQTVGPLQNAAICVTGTFQIPRKDIKQKIELAGGKFVTAVTSKTKYLLVGKEPGDEKIKSAERNQIPQLSEEAFYDLLNAVSKNNES